MKANGVISEIMLMIMKWPINNEINQNQYLVSITVILKSNEESGENEMAKMAAINGQYQPSASERKCQ
jgi:hypothetical protein